MNRVSDKFRRNLIVFVAVLLTIVVGTSLPFFSTLLPDLINKVNIKSAIADVAKYNLDDGESLYLSGEWEFFWGKHIISDGLRNPEADAFVQVPSSWTTYDINGKKLPNGGRASYRINLKNISAWEFSQPNIAIFFISVLPFFLNI